MHLTIKTLLRSSFICNGREAVKLKAGVSQAAQTCTFKSTLPYPLLKSELQCARPFAALLMLQQQFLGRRWSRRSRRRCVS